MAGRMTLSTRQSGGSAGLLRRYGQQAIVRLRAVTQESAERVYQTAQILCPVETGYMRAHMRKQLTPSGLGFEVGFDGDDFPDEPYFIHQEFGTTTMPAQPCIFPAAEAERPRYRRAIREALKPSRGVQPVRR